MAQDRAKYHQMGTSLPRRISTGPLIAIIALTWYGVFCSKVIFAKFVTSLHMIDAEKMSLPIVPLSRQVWYRLPSVIVGQTPFKLRGSFAMFVGRNLKKLQLCVARYVHTVCTLNARTSLFLIVKNVPHSFLTAIWAPSPTPTTGAKGICLPALNVQSVGEAVGQVNVSQAYAANGVAQRSTQHAVSRCPVSAGLEFWSRSCYHPRLLVFPV